MLKQTLRYLALAAAVFAVFWLLKLPCPILGLTGVPCPTCGVSRALFALLAGDVAASLALHPLAVPLTVAVLLCLLLPVVKRKGLQISIYVFVGVVLAANTGYYLLKLMHRV